jgi:hypothetical protein
LNRQGTKIYTGTVGAVGTSYVPVTVAGLPRAGWIERITIEATAGPGGAARILILDPTTSDTLVEYDDPDNPGDPITFPFDVGDTAVWFERGTLALLVSVACDDGTNATTLSVSLSVRAP